MSNSVNTNGIIKVVSFNMNGRTKNIDEFKKFLKNVDIVCLQEVDDVVKTRAGYLDYPYSFASTNKKTKGSGKTSLMILSKYPFEKCSEKIIQIDPTVHKWTRNAQYAIIKISDFGKINLFNYHNTYNPTDQLRPQDKKFQYEKKGLVRLIAWIENSLGIRKMHDAKNLVLAGDFNLPSGRMNLLPYENYSYNWVDGVFLSNDLNYVSKGYYAVDDKKGSKLSDHNAPYISFSIETNQSAARGIKVTIKNTERPFYLSVGGKITKDGRREVTASKNKSDELGCEWLIERIHGDFVKIFNTKYCEYLYVSLIKLYDRDRRSVFTLGSAYNETTDMENVWEIEGISQIFEKNDMPSSVNIYSFSQAEFMYLAEFAAIKKGETHRVFTWVPGNCVVEAGWNISAV